MGGGFPVDNEGKGVGRVGKVGKVGWGPAKEPAKSMRTRLSTSLHPMVSKRWFESGLEPGVDIPTKLVRWPAPRRSPTNPEKIKVGERRVGSRFSGNSKSRSKIPQE